MSSSWTGGFIRLTRLLPDGTKYVTWTRAASIFDLMVSSATMLEPGKAPKAALITIVTAAYQGAVKEMWVEEGPDTIISLIEAIVKSGAISGVDER